jgi:hypothetical protein
LRQWTAQPWPAILIIAAFGLALRLVAARGDLWLDEIWSFVLIQPLTSIDQIFWRVSHDNNHFLNSAYLYLIGPDASPSIQRGLSIALGTATVIAAAAAASARGHRTMIATALLFAVSYPMVHYGSEARGYAGLVLFTLLSIVFLERRLDGSRWSGLLFATAILAGLLSHLTMIGTLAVLIIWVIPQAWLRTRRLDRAFVDICLILTPVALAVLPLATCIIVGDQLFGFKVGGFSPFSLAAFGAGYGGMIRDLFGLPSYVGDWVCILAACSLVCASACIWRDRRAALYVIGILGLPYLMAVAHLPNVGFPRYFLISGTLLLLWAGEMLGRGFEIGGKKLLLTAVALVTVLAGNAWSLVQFYQYGRGSYLPIIEQMTQDGATSYASNHDFRTATVVGYFTRRMGRQASFVPTDKMCEERPTWLILEDAVGKQPQHVEPVPGCVLAYERTAGSTHWGLSGLDWTLYRLQD